LTLFRAFLSYLLKLGTERSWGSASFRKESTVDPWDLSAEQDSELSSTMKPSQHHTKNKTKARKTASKSRKQAWCQWLLPVIPATWENRRITV
jgi:hypothetical protein